VSKAGFLYSSGETMEDTTAVSVCILKVLPLNPERLRHNRESSHFLSNGMAQMDDRKKRIMEHLARSTNDFNKPLPARSPERKQRILDHVRRTTGG